MGSAYSFGFGRITAKTPVTQEEAARRRIPLSHLKAEVRRQRKERDRQAARDRNFPYTGD